jgi:hypothetical protein
VPESADGVFGLPQPVQNVARRFEQALAGRGQHQTFADPQKERGAEALLDVAELMAERRLREVKAIAGPGKAPDVGDRGDQLQVSDLEIHGP